MDIECAVLPVAGASGLARARKLVAHSGPNGVLLAMLDSESDRFGIAIHQGWGPIKSAEEEGQHRQRAERLIDAVTDEDLPCELGLRGGGASALSLLRILRRENTELMTCVLTVPQASEAGGQFQMRRLQRGIQAAAVEFVSLLMRP